MVSITGTISDFINVFLICSSVEFQLDALDTLEDSTSGLSSLSSFSSILYPFSGSILGPFIMNNDYPSSLSADLGDFEDEGSSVGISVGDIPKGLGLSSCKGEGDEGTSVGISVGDISKGLRVSSSITDICSMSSSDLTFSFG